MNRSWRDLFRKKGIGEIQNELAESGSTSSQGLTKNLGLFDLICFGIAAIIGAGIFSTIGNAAASGGPAVTLLFVLTAIACLFSALCYAEFASAIPISGSAYTYSYAAFGELVAWIIGWNLLLEYAIGNSTVAFSWSEYFTNLVHGTNIFGWSLRIPDWLCTDFYSCYHAARDVANAATNGVDPATLDGNAESLATIWRDAPTLMGLKIILDAPALAINILVTCLVYIGIKESKNASNLLVMLKIGVVLLVIVVGIFYVQPANWSPFAPRGIEGVLEGIAGVFFAYIGFDAISTTAEECKNPKRDLPRATLFTLIVCTVLYVIIALVLTGMVSYKYLGVEDPLAFVFEQHQLKSMEKIVSISAVIAITSVFLVFQVGQPRIWMSMARDGLLPSRFARIHPKYKTPSFATVVTGVVVALPTLLLNQAVVTNLCSIGTLFAFLLVSAGILALENDPARIEHATFRVPYINGRWLIPGLCLGYLLCLPWLPPNHSIRWEDFRGSEVEVLTTWDFLSLIYERSPYYAFLLVFLVMAWLSWAKRWSAIPVLGVLINLYLIAGLGHTNWVRFFVWCFVGLLVYFLYGFWNSKLRRRPSAGSGGLIRSDSIES